MLSDTEWGHLARDIMDRTGLAPHGQDAEAVRWLAVRHADDHIHIVGTLARQDGTRPQFWNDYYRVREACRAAEERHGLWRTAPRDRTADRRPARAEHEKARRQGRPEAPRITLRRAVSTAAAGAGSEEEFFARLREAGVQVRARYSTRNPGQVTGYAVALTGDTARAGGPVWFSGGKLAGDLSLPKLRARWDGASSGTQPRIQLTAEEGNAIWENAARTAHEARDRIRLCATTDPAAASDAAWAASDTLHASPTALGSRVIRQAADSYARAARMPYARIPRPGTACARLPGCCPAPRSSARTLRPATPTWSPSWSRSWRRSSSCGRRSSTPPRPPPRAGPPSTCTPSKNGSPGGRKAAPPGRRGWPLRASRSRPGPQPAHPGRTSLHGPVRGHHAAPVPPGRAVPPGEHATPAATRTKPPTEKRRRGDMTCRPTRSSR
jgi:hypothetical protein